MRYHGGMRRWVFRIVSALSLVLCVATVVLWVRSYTTGIELGVENEAEVPPSNDGLFPINLDRRFYYLAADNRGISYTVDHELSSGRAQGWRAFVANLQGGRADSGPPDVGCFGFGYRSRDKERFSSFECSFREWTLPYWALTLLLAFLPTLAIRSGLRKRHRRPSGHCPSCGYDLRATPDRCPECGVVPATR
jgi:hypothetical protein